METKLKKKYIIQIYNPETGTIMDLDATEDNVDMYRNNPFITIITIE